MPTQSIAARYRRSVKIIFVPAILGALLLPFTDTPSTAYPKLQQDQGKTGELSISTKPDGYPMSLDRGDIGKTSDVTFELSPGSHTVEIVFPNDLRWTHEFKMEAGDCFDVNLTYTPHVVGGKSSPTPAEADRVEIVAPDTVRAGDALTFEAMLPDSVLKLPQLRYEWKISPPGAHILSGAGTPAITVDTAGLASGPVTAALNITEPHGWQFFAQTSTFVSTDGLPPSRPVELGTLTATISTCRYSRIPVGEPSRRGRRRRPQD
jgi:hypothetical protein